MVKGSKMNCKQKMDWRKAIAHAKAFTLVELLVVIGIISVLLGLLLPAVQQVREAARGVTCRNHLRQLGLAAMNYENTFEYLPGPWFNAPPDTAAYTSDRGLFVQLLPYLEQQNRYDRLRTAATTFDLANQSVLAEPLPILTCPSSAKNPTLLTDIAGLFSGPAIGGLNSVTCDYIGCGGYTPSSPIDPALTDGAIGVQIPNSGIPKEQAARITDGLSNTLLIWESIGSVIILSGSGNVELDPNTQANGSFTLSIFGSPSLSFTSSGMASTKSYVHSCAGLGLGSIREVGGGVLNVGNQIGEPCSYHPGGANSVLVDGSIRHLPRDIDPQIAFALASARGREVVPGF